MKYKVTLTWAAGKLEFGPVAGISRPVYEVEAANGAEAVQKAIAEADAQPGARSGPLEHLCYRVKSAVAVPVDPALPAEVINEPEETS